jgi:hypothetical protein
VIARSGFDDPGNATEKEKVTVDFETKDGGSFRQNPVLVYRDGRWRMKPESVTVAN